MAEDIPKQSPVTRDRFSPREQRQNEWVCTMQFGAHPTAALDPTYWSFVAQDMRPYDKIQVRVDDGTWYGELLVKGCERTWAAVEWMPGFPMDLTTQDVAITEAQQVSFDVKWRGPKCMFSVVNVKTGAVVKDEFSRRDDANAYLREHIRTINS